MLGNFKTIAPSWDIPGVNVCTFLATDTQGDPVSFSLFTQLGKYCRERIESLIQPLEPIEWLNQVHGNELVELPLVPEDGQMEIFAHQPVADASFTYQQGIVCAILTADCLPIVLAHEDGTFVATLHVGRRGLENQLISKMVQNIEEPNRLYAWIGPGIAFNSYPISDEIRLSFLLQFPNLAYVFKPTQNGDFCMDITEIARVQLLEAGLLKERVSYAVRNTFTDPELHSARRDGDASGRMATLAWLD